MSEIISVQEVLKALANGGDVQSKSKDYDGWSTCVKFWTVNEIMSYDGEFRLKPRTISINGIEVPVPFDPKEGEKYWYISTRGEDKANGYSRALHFHDTTTERFQYFGAWRTEEEIIQVVEALRSIFK